MMLSATKDDAASTQEGRHRLRAGIGQMPPLQPSGHSVSVRRKDRRPQKWQPLSQRVPHLPLPAPRSFPYSRFLLFPSLHQASSVGSATALEKRSPRLHLGRKPGCGPTAACLFHPMTPKSEKRHSADQLPSTCGPSCENGKPASCGPTHCTQSRHQSSRRFVNRKSPQLWTNSAPPSHRPPPCRLGGDSYNRTSSHMPRYITV
jgi:hypothetical protein